MADSSRIDFLYLSEPDMIRAGVTDMPACIDTMEEVFGLLWRGDYRMAGANNDSHGAMIMFPDSSPFPNMPKNTPDRRMMAMPAYLGGRFGTAGAKWYVSNPDNRQRGLPRSILMFTLNDPDTGAPLAHMSANLLSAYRTGAVPGVGARHLARKDARVMGLSGPGVMGRTVCSAFLSVCPQIDTLQLKGRGRPNIDTFLAWLAKNYPQVKNVRLVNSYEEVVRGADVVSYCCNGDFSTPADYPPVKREWVKPGAFLAMPAACTIDAGMEQPDVRKVLDNTGLYEAWYDESPKPAHGYVPIVGVHFLDMVGEGRMDKAQLEDMGKIVLGEAPGRRNDEEIILMSVGGMPVEDVGWGTVLYHNALAKGLGVKLNLWDAPALR